MQENEDADLYSDTELDSRDQQVTEDAANSPPHLGFDAAPRERTAKNTTATATNETGSPQRQHPSTTKSIVDPTQSQKYSIPHQNDNKKQTKVNTDGRRPNQTKLGAEQEAHEKKKSERKKAGLVLLGVFIAVVIILLVVTQVQRNANEEGGASNPSEGETSKQQTKPPVLQPSPETAAPGPELPWTDACTPSGPFATPQDEMGYLKQRVDQFLGYGTRVAGSDSRGYRMVHDMITTMSQCNGEDVWKIELDDFVDSTPIGRKNFSNIVSTFQYGNESLGHLVLSAHFDSKLYKDIMFLGACDSAVPCVQLLEIMKKVSTAVLEEKQESGDPTTANFISQKLPKITIMFFDGEEAFVEWTGTDNTYGARHLAQEWQTQGRIKNITLFVLLDLIGPVSPLFHNYFPSKTGASYHRMRNIEIKNRNANQAQSSKPVTAIGGHTMFPNENVAKINGMQDDHIPWLNRGVPVLHLIPYPFPKVWHTGGDSGGAVDYATTYDTLKIFEEFTLTYKSPAARRRMKKQ